MTPEERARAALYPALDNVFDEVLRQIRAAVAEERERCAAMLDPMGCSEFCGESGADSHAESCYQRLAAAMRAGA